MSKSGEENVKKKNEDTIELPSGRSAIIRKGKGRDLIKAQMMVTNPETEINLALIAVLVEIDGEKLTFEDVLDMDLGDVITLLPLLGMPLETPPGLSSDSPKAG